MSDGSGYRISEEDFEVIVDGHLRSVPWTLSTYMNASGLKWPSGIRLYCVNMSAFSGNESLIITVSTFMYMLWHTDGENKKDRAKGVNDGKSHCDL